MKVPYVNLGKDVEPIRGQLSDKFNEIIKSGYYILGPEVSTFEERFAKICGSKSAIGVSNGTSALYLLLKAIGVGPGDEVITAPNSFIASASVVAMTGATPVFADIGDNLNISPEEVRKKITKKTKVIMPVHLTGRPYDFEAINEIAKSQDIFVLEDAAQAYGASKAGKKVGGMGHAAGFSLHPLKNLHAFGDAGIITLNGLDDLDERIRRARNLGFVDRDHCQFPSGNDRLDEMQAGLLNIYLDNMDHFQGERSRKAKVYIEELGDLVITPNPADDETCVFQTFVLQVEKRDELLAYLRESGVDAKIHYPVTIIEQEAFKNCDKPLADYPCLHRKVNKVISLPLYPSLEGWQQELVINSVRSFYAR